MLFVLFWFQLPNLWFMTKVALSKLLVTIIFGILAKS
ncbi:MAG: hypothetical protein FD155_3143 [Bacteroidetes bacterium]|nr:MAG: hypothetical protein FD155_3143 [Bacteroidota bacterium]